MGSALDAKRGHVTKIFRNEINAMRDARGGVNVPRDFTGQGCPLGGGGVRERPGLSIGATAAELTSWKLSIVCEAPVYAGPFFFLFLGLRLGGVA